MDSYTQDFSNDDEDWSSSLELSINATRLLYGVIDHALETWPGSPARPHIEQEFLHSLKNTLFGSIMDYNLLHNTANKKNGDSE